METITIHILPPELCCIISDFLGPYVLSLTIVCKDINEKFPIIPKSWTYAVWNDITRSGNLKLLQWFA
ncbi:hypothetical protein NL529_34440, partial [Klebsiella pneumoniae]|nr:hypothetical protein [Klebsiella pneumoniae]